MKRKALLYALIAIVFISLVACGSKKSPAEDEEAQKKSLENLTDSGQPIVKEPITLDIFAGKTPQTAEDWNDVMIFNEYEKMTNIDVNWEMVPHASLEEKRNLALASGNLPDVFHSAEIPTADILKYGEQGVFIPLNDLIEEHAPNLKKLFEENPEIEKGLTFPDGKIYSLPSIFSPEFLSMRIGAKPWINEEWLDALDMEMPETTDEFYDYLKAVKEDDPNGNGEADEIPYGGAHMGWLTEWLKGSFGIGNQGPANGNVDLDPDGDGMRFYPTSTEYKELLQYMNKLFSEGLIEQNIYSIDTNQYLSNASEGLYGSTNWFSPVDIFGKEAGEAFTGMPTLEGPHGDKMFTHLIPSIQTLGAFLITSENEDPAATIRWIDYFYGEEGTELFFMGIEGETFEKTADGEYEYLDKITDSADGLTFEQEVAKYLTWPGAGYPSIAEENFFKGAESAPKSIEAADKLEPDLIEDVWPSFIFTKEENDKLASFGADIDKYVEEMRDKFVSGETSFDEWDKYVETLENMNIEEYLEIKETALERYE